MRIPKQSLSDRFYPNPEKYKLVPDGKILVPFGLEVSGSQVQFHRGVFFGKKGQLCYEIYSPINADSFSYNHVTKTLTLFDNRSGFCLRIYGIRSLSLQRKNQTVRRGEYLGTAFQIRSLEPGVYVEGIILQDSFKNMLERRFEASETKIESYLTDKDFLKRWSSTEEGRTPTELRKQIRIATYREKVSEANPYWIVQRPSPYKPYNVYFNYSALFC